MQITESSSSFLFLLYNAYRKSVSWNTCRQSDLMLSMSFSVGGSCGMFHGRCVMMMLSFHLGFAIVSTCMCLEAWSTFCGRNFLWHFFSLSINIVTLLPRVQLIVSWHWFRQWLGAGDKPILNQCWQRSLMPLWQTQCFEQNMFRSAGNFQKGFGIFI